MQINDINKNITKTYRKTIWKKAIKAIDQYQMINEGDHIGVCISGGKDSFLLALVLREILRHHKIKFKLSYIVMDPGYSKPAIEKIKENAALFELDIHLFKSNIFKEVENEDKPCYLCARKRRGHLYNKAKELGCNKIALGHHFDDVIETIMLNILYAGKYGSMLPKLKATNYPGMELIRPLYFVKEGAIQNWLKHNNFTFINCACPLADQKCEISAESGKEVSKRKEMKELINQLRKIYPDVDKNILKSSENVNLDTILGYYNEETRHTFLDKY